MAKKGDVLEDAGSSKVVGEVEKGDVREERGDGRFF